MRVFLIEDNRLLRQALQRALEEEGHLVEVAGDRALAEFRIVAGAHDVVLLDVVRRERDGLALLRRWRRSRLNTPVLVLGSPGARTDSSAGLHQEADGFLAIPFGLDELLAQLQALTSRQRPRAGAMCS